MNRIISITHLWTGEPLATLEVTTDSDDPDYLMFEDIDAAGEAVGVWCNQNGTLYEDVTWEVVPEA